MPCLQMPCMCFTYVQAGRRVRSTTTLPQSLRRAHQQRRRVSAGALVATTEAGLLCSTASQQKLLGIPVMSHHSALAAPARPITPTAGPQITLNFLLQNTITPAAMLDNAQSQATAEHVGPSAELSIFSAATDSAGTGTEVTAMHDIAAAAHGTSAHSGVVAPAQPAEVCTVPARNATEKEKAEARLYQQFIDQRSTHTCMASLHSKTIESRRQQC